MEEHNRVCDFSIVRLSTEKCQHGEGLNVQGHVLNKSVETQHDYSLLISICSSVQKDSFDSSRVT
jgi:hypothetical protein